MKMKLILFFSLLHFSKIFAQGEQTYSLAFEGLFKEEKLDLEKWYKLSENDSILFENVKFYISSIEFYQDNLLLFREKKSYHLIDFSDSSTQNLSFKLQEKVKFDEIRFILGIDSLTNAGGVKSDDLDPTNGMYWTWQTGYIHFKMEGKSNLCKTRNNVFSYHLGGFSFPNNTIQSISLKSSHRHEIPIKLNLYNYFTALDLRTENHIMSPNLEAVKLSKKIASLFYTE